MVRSAATPYPVTLENRWRHRYTLATIVVTVALLSWGGLVTSIDAGLAVPDWPTSFGSMDPFATGFEDPNNPSARWWHHLPILAEHGHRLLGALVGLFTLGLAIWTFFKDPRAWMRKLGLAALILVGIQGLLGGLRVTEISVVLALVHACVAQLFFALLVALALFTSRSWLQTDALVSPSPATKRLRRLALATVGALYGQIILGALLRHYGFGVDPVFAGIHITGALVVLGLVLAVFVTIRRGFADNPLLNRGASSLLAVVALQITLGFSAFLVIVYETQTAQRSMVQIVLNSAHLVVGALLMAAAVSIALLALRRPPAPSYPASDASLIREPVPSVGS